MRPHFEGPQNRPQPLHPSLLPQVKGTLLLMPNGNDLITKAPVQPAESEKKVEDPELLKLLNSGEDGRTRTHVDPSWAAAPPTATPRSTLDPEA